METTPSSTMDEILAGYTGEGKYESTIADIAEFKDFVTGVLEALLNLINELKKIFEK